MVGERRQSETPTPTQIRPPNIAFTCRRPPWCSPADRRCKGPRGCQAPRGRAEVDIFLFMRPNNLLSLEIPLLWFDEADAGVGRFEVARETAAGEGCHERAEERGLLAQGDDQDLVRLAGHPAAYVEG